MNQELNDAYTTLLADFESLKGPGNNPPAANLTPLRNLRNSKRPP